MGVAGNLTAEQARRLLRYDPETGRLFWFERPREMFACDGPWKIWNKRFAEREALANLDNEGYRRGAVLGRRYKAHRIIWLMQTGEWPVGQVDHINGGKADNRWHNLRDVSNAENGRNQSLFSTNKSGVNGVSWNTRRQRWQANIWVDGRQRSLGYFQDLEAAAAVRSAANVKYGFSPRHGRAA